MKDDRHNALDKAPDTEVTPPTSKDAAHQMLAQAVPGAASPADRKEVMLPSGKKASIMLKYKGKHVLQASRAAGGAADPMKFTFGLIAVKTLIDGKPITIETIEEELDGDDVMKLIAEAMGNGNTSSSDT